jgi:hypothetical protein
MLESKYVTNTINLLNKLPRCKAVKFVENAYTEIGTPDILVCYVGKLIVVEAKIEGNTASDIQITRLNEWAKVSAIAIIATYPQHSPKYIYDFVKSLLIIPPYSMHQADHETWQSYFENGRWRYAD